MTFEASLLSVGPESRHPVGNAIAFDLQRCREASKPTRDDLVLYRSWAFFCTSLAFGPISAGMPPEYPQSGTVDGELGADPGPTARPSCSRAKRKDARYMRGCMSQEGVAWLKGAREALNALGDC